MTSARMRHSDAQNLTMKAAHEHGQDELARMILDGTARVYTRTSKSRPGWQVSDWDRPVPDGTEIVVLLDVYDPSIPPKFSLIPADVYANLISTKRHPRARNPESRHCYVTPDDAKEWLNFWTIRDHIDASG